jgi:hypothetical protein
MDKYCGSNGPCGLAIGIAITKFGYHNESPERRQLAINLVSVLGGPRLCHGFASRTRVFGNDWVLIRIARWFKHTFAAGWIGVNVKCKIHAALGFHAHDRIKHTQRLALSNHNVVARMLFCLEHLSIDLNRVVPMWIEYDVSLTYNHNMLFLFRMP